MQKVSLTHKLACFDDRWSPRIVGELNGQHVKVVKLQGDFVWHHHEAEDELFLILKGTLRMEYREADQEKSIDLYEGEFLIVPRGVEHRPCADEECHLMLFEPVTTLNTGNVQSERTVHEPARI